MAKRHIIKIDEEKCNGCGQCVTACAEGAIQLIDGKARLVSESYCDGLGACLGTCPMDAITIEEREAAAFDEGAAMAHVANLDQGQAEKSKPMEFMCPSVMAMTLKPKVKQAGVVQEGVGSESQLGNWPVQLKLVSPMAGYLKGADVLLVADCVPFALADFHERYLRGRPVLIGCPKLDDINEYVEKMVEIFRQGQLKSLTVIHMEVPCCSGLGRIVEAALAEAKVEVPVNDITIGINGTVVSERYVNEVVNR